MNLSRYLGCLGKKNEFSGQKNTSLNFSATKVVRIWGGTHDTSFVP
jgi:hypothetical protein